MHSMINGSWSIKAINIEGIIEKMAHGILKPDILNALYEV